MQRGVVVLSILNVLVVLIADSGINVPAVTE